MPEPWELTPEEFHGVLNPTGTRDETWSGGFDETARTEFGYYRQVRPVWTEVIDGRRYGLVPYGATADYFLVHFPHDSNEIEVVGMKTNETLMIADEHRGVGLGVAVTLAIFARSPWDKNPTLSVTEGGAKTLRGAHRKSVKDAFSAGKAVPQSNLDHYGFR